MSSSNQDAVNSAQDSKEQAAKASDGNLSQLRKEAKLARKANNRSGDAKDALDNQKDNKKDIEKLTAKIEKKQKRIAELDQMRSAITSGSATAPQSRLCSEFNTFN